MRLDAYPRMAVSGVRSSWLSRDRKPRCSSRDRRRAAASWCARPASSRSRASRSECAASSMSAASSVVARSCFQLATRTVGPPGAMNAAATIRRPRALLSCLATPSRCGPARVFTAMLRRDGDTTAGSWPSGPAKARHCGVPPSGWVSRATSSACSPRRNDSSATVRPWATGTGPAKVSSISRIVSSTRLRAVTWSSSRSRSTALAAYPA